MAASALQEAVPFEKRSAEARRILLKYPDRIPVICEKASRSDLPDIDKKKFLVPGTMLCGEFKYIIHKHINQTANATIASDQTIYLLVNNAYNASLHSSLLQNLTKNPAAVLSFSY